MPLHVPRSPDRSVASVDEFGSSPCEDVDPKDTEEEEAELVTVLLRRVVRPLKEVESGGGSDASCIKDIRGSLSPTNDPGEEPSDSCTI